MSEQRIDTGADAATSTDADPGEGLGTAGPSADPRGATGEDAEMPQPTADGPGGTGTADPADTEGERYLRDTQAKQAGSAGAGGRKPVASGSDEQPPAGREDRAGATGASSRTREADDPHVGEPTAKPSQRRREADPGSVAEEFGDRAGTAPDDEVAHPTI